jgi:ribose 5-phosphate isomerase A
MDKQTVSQLQMKEAAGNKAADTMVSSGMKLGLGTGSTAVFAIRRIGELLAQGALRDIYAFATSFQTEIECEKLGIPFFPLNSRKLAGSLDLIIDGADEVDPQRCLIKGGGGALLLEKIAAYNSAACAITVDETKLTGSLGAGFPIPVEVVAEARVCACRALEALGAAVTLREALRKAGPVITDRGNLILDIRFAAPIDPAAMEREINLIPGVLENGLFTRVDPVIYIGRSDGTVEIRKPEVTK